MEKSKQLVITILAEDLDGIEDKEGLIVLKRISETPMIVRLIHEMQKLNPRKIFIVTGKNEILIKDVLREFMPIHSVEFINQGELNGSGYAIENLKNKLKKYNYSNVLILKGNVPLFSKAIVSSMLERQDKVQVCIGKMQNPGRKDRVVIKDNKLKKIININDCKEEEMKIKYYHTGIYLIDNMILCKYVDYIKNNNSKFKYYLSDIIEIIKNYENIAIQMNKIGPTEHIQIMPIIKNDDLKEIDCYVGALECIY